MIARKATTADLLVGQEILYFQGGEYLPGVVLHGVVDVIFDVVNPGTAGEYTPVRLDTSRLPVKLFATRPLYIVGS